MLKKTIAVGLVLCLALGGAIGLAEEGAGTSGALESALAYMQEADSLSIDAQFAVRQNGEDLVTGDALYQSAGDVGYANAAISHVDGETIEMEMSSSGDTCTFRIDDDFYAIPVEKDAEDDVDEAEDEDEAAHSANEYLGTVMDQLFGDAGDKMMISETGLGLHLAGDEVPAILNLAVSMMGSHAGADASSAATPAMRAIQHGKRGEAEAPVEDTRVMPSMGSNLHIDRIDLDISIEGEVVTGMQCSIVFVGTAEDGATIETEFAAVIRVTDVNDTVPAAIDLTGVQMRPMKMHRRGR